MNEDIPNANSTPKIVDIRGRRPIGTASECEESPISHERKISEMKMLNKSRHIIRKISQSEGYEAEISDNDDIKDLQKTDNDTDTSDESPELNNHKISRSTEDSLRNYKSSSIDWYAANRIPESTRYNQESDQTDRNVPKHFIPESSSYGTELGDACLDKDLHFNGEDNIKTNKEIGKNKGISIYTCGHIILIAIITYCFVFVGTKLSDIEEKPNLEQELVNLSKEFPSQIEDFWIHIRVGIRDIIEKQRPKTFLFLYTDEGKVTADKLLNNIANLATCFLTNCSAKPVTLEGSGLNITDILEDYGKIITNHEEQLRESGVMIIKNLDEMSGVSAQAFHSLCDEYNPIIGKSLFLFTIRVEQFYENNVKFTEKYLHRLWGDIKDDKFFPLFTRLSSNILPIIVEK